MNSKKRKIFEEKLNDIISGGLGDGVTLDDIVKKYNDELEERGFDSYKEKHEAIEDIVKEGIKVELEHVGTRNYNDQEIKNFLNNDLEDLKERDIGVLKTSKEIAIDHIYGESLEYYNFLEKAEKEMSENMNNNKKKTKMEENFSNRMKELIGEKENPQKKQRTNKDLKVEDDRKTLLREEAQKLAEELEETFGEEIRDQVIEAIEKHGMIQDRADNAMREINDILGGYGTEAIFAENSWQPYWMDSVGVYVNTGDSTDKTIIYNTTDEEFMVNSVENFVMSLYEEGYEIK